MIKKVILLLFVTSYSFSQSNKSATNHIDTLLNDWHKAAANANFKVYFNLMTNDAVFIGTDANEHWAKTEFMAYAKPHFDKGKAWSFTSIQRHIYLSQNNKMAWFDELLSTQMKICRGSGVAELTKQGWKIKQYVLSMTVPNELSASVTTLKTSFDVKLIDGLKK